MYVNTWIACKFKVANGSLIGRLEKMVYIQENFSGSYLTQARLLLSVAVSLFVFFYKYYYVFLFLRWQ